MENSTIKLTRKIQIVIDLPTYEEKKEVYKRLYTWQKICYQAANLITAHLYIHEMINDFFYLSENIKYKLINESKADEGILKCSRIGATYSVVSKRFKGEIPTDILTCTNNLIYSSFNKTKTEYSKGIRSLDNYKRDIPLPFKARSLLNFRHNEEHNEFYFKLFKIPFKTYLGNDYHDKRKLLERLTKGQIKLCSSKIKLDKGKIFWLAVFDIEKENHNLNSMIIAEASLSLEYPITVKIDKKKLQIGSKEEFLYRRLAIQNAYKRAQHGVTYSKSAHGRKRKLKALDKLKTTENNYVSYRIHQYSRKLIDFCIKHNAGTLILLNQEDKIGIAKEEHFILRNWSYYELTAKIKYKAKKAGIELIVD